MMVDFEELHQYLKQEQSRLGHDLEQLRGEMKSAGQGHEGSLFGKREDEAVEAFELEKSLALERRLVNSLADVEHAINKYEAGTYGVCDICGKAIEPARLEALPQASMCLECKARQAKDARKKPLY